MIEVGRLCIKTAGRDSRKKCMIVEVLDDNFVIVDGETRRKKCNIRHLEPLDKKIDIKKGADHKTVVSEFKKLGIEIKEKKSKPKTERPKRTRKKKVKAEQEKKETKKAEKPKETGLAGKVEEKSK